MQITNGQRSITVAANKDLVTARLELIAAKARILCEDYKNNKLWDVDLTKGLVDIETEIKSIRSEANIIDSWRYITDNR
jgi:hypothetical protein